VLGALTMFDRTREQPARVFGMECLVRRAEVSGESTHLLLTPLFLSIYAHETLLIRKVALKESMINVDSPDASDYVCSRS
jgi:hypothetical protein